MLLIKDGGERLIAHHHSLSFHPNWLSAEDMVNKPDLLFGGTRLNRKKLEKHIWGKSIASARTHGLISEEEAKFLLDEYLKEFKAKTDWKSQNFGHLFGRASSMGQSVNASMR